MYLLDTDVVSAVRRRDRIDPKLAAWMGAANAEELYLSVITVREIEGGILSIERRDTSQGKVLRRWFDGKVLPGFAERIISIDTAVALRCARLHVPDPRPHADAFIAATALVHGLTIVTRNVAHFRLMGVDLLNPWE